MEGLYNKSIECPVCSKSFEITKVKAKACKVASRDTDFCVYYEGLNPIIYDILVCENCGYAAQTDKFEGISFNDSKIILNTISPKWKKRSFSGERSIENAIEAFKLALYVMHIRKAKPSEIARICIRIAWMYRLKNDAKELDFMKFALASYVEAYEKESLPSENKLDENTCLYMIGELNRRLSNFDDSIKWFSRLISSPGARKNPGLMESARNQFQLAKDHQSKS